MIDVDILEHSESDIGTIYLGRRRIPTREEWIYEIGISGNLLMSSLHNISERALSTRALELHQGTGPLRVLVGGLGLGYTAQAALENVSVSSVRVIEKMDFVMNWMEQGKLPLSAQFAADSRLEVVQGDVYEQLLAPPTELYDLILVDVDHAPNYRLASGIGRFYTEEGQQAVARHLRPGGVLAVWSAWDNDAFAAVLKRGYARTSVEEVRWDDEEDEEHLGRYFANTLFFASGEAPAA